MQMGKTFLITEADLKVVPHYAICNLNIKINDGKRILGKYNPPQKVVDLILFKTDLRAKVFFLFFLFFFGCVGSLFLRVGFL